MAARGGVGVGLIGYGLAGAYFHAPLIRAVARLSLVAVATSRREPQPPLPPDVRVHADAEALLAEPAVDLVVIATPNVTHFPLASAALRAGRHVVVDKPLAVDVAESDALAALAARERRVLAVFHNRRWDGDFLTVQQLLETGRLGRVTTLHAHWDRFRPAIRAGWRETPAPGAGLLADLGPHLVDQVLQLFGRPDALDADVAIQRAGASVDDHFEIRFHYGSSRACVGASSIVAAPRPRFAVHGTLGSYVKHGLDPQEAQLRAGVQPGAPTFGIEDPGAHGRLVAADGAVTTLPTQRGCWSRFYEGVADAILDGAPPPVAAGDARRGLEILELARRSARDGVRIALA